MNVHNHRRLWISLFLLIGYAPGVTSHWYYPQLRNGTLGYWITEICVWILLPLLVLWTGMQRKLFNYRDLGMHRQLFRKPATATGLILTIGLILLWLPFNLWISHLFQGWLSPHMVSGGPLLQTPKVSATHLIHFAYLSLSAGLVEEFYGRSVLGTIFKRSFSQMFLYVCISATVFSLIHWEGGLGYLAFTFIWGLCFGVGYLWVGSVWPFMVAHALYDGLAYCGISLDMMASLLP